MTDIEAMVDLSEDKPREECGVFGVWGHERASGLTALGLHALQHRGQEACGITTFDGALFHNERRLGLVGEAFGGGNLAKNLPGQGAIGHVRYSTQGKTVPRNIQPIYADLATGGLAIAHNGNITNARDNRRALVKAGAIFQSTMDTEVILHLLARSNRAKLVDRLIDALFQIEGGYAVVALSNKKLIGARDPVGLRPLVLGDLDGRAVLASETCALDIVGASFVRDVENGEVIVISDEGVQSLHPFPVMPARPCVFEFVYFARPDSIVQGKSVYDVRRRMGLRLAEETRVDADVVIPVPDSGVPAALGFAEASSIPFQLGIIRNHYVGRTFIQPSQDSRITSVSMKHSPNRSQIEGKRVVLVDDSIVRGNTSKKIVQMVRDAGAREIHFRSASPPIRFGDYYGIDMPSQSELMAARMSQEEMTKELKVDSLGFLSVEGLYWALGEKERNASAPQFSDHCFTGDYPTRLIDRDNAMEHKERQMSLLDDM